MLVSNSTKYKNNRTYLKLNLGLSNVLFATVAAGDLLCLRNLVLDSLGAEVLKGVALNSVDAELGTGLNSGETAGDYGHSVLVGCLDSRDSSLM